MTTKSKEYEILARIAAAGTRTRRVAPDANTLHCWKCTESALPLANSGSSTLALSRIYSLVVSNATLQRSGGVALAKCAEAGQAPDANPAHGYTSPDSVSAGDEPGTFTADVWVNLKSGYGFGFGHIFAKWYRAQGSWSAPFVAWAIDVKNTLDGQWDVSISSAGTIHTTSIGSGENKLQWDTWHHLGFSYDPATSGGSIKVYKDGVYILGATGLGTIDYGLHGPYAVGISGTGSEYINGFIQDARVSNIVRPDSYFQSIWETGMQLSGT